MSTNPLRNLPSVTQVLDAPAVVALRAEYGHDRTVEAVRATLANLRESVRAAGMADGECDVNTVAERVAAHLRESARPKLRPVINATGIVLHTNLGRAPIADLAARAAADAARGYLNLELDLASGERSSRSLAVREWVCRLTGAESATAVNNCAAATVIVLRALAAGREVIVSRGQLVEIGGSFRIPEIMGVSGATLREVGATNITRAADYERAIGPNTGLLMRIHQSNFRIHGFTESPTLEELVALGRKHNLPVVDDIGSGALVDFARFGLDGEPVAQASIAAGADLILFSGDKLLGGPQAGIIAGRVELVKKIERDPLMRAFRLDKMTLAALEATLRLYLNEERALAERLRAISGLRVGVRNDVAFVGGGSLPDRPLATAVIEISSRDVSDAELAARLRTGTPAVLGRVQDGKVLLDMRTVFDDQMEPLVEAVRAAVSGLAGS